MINDDIMATSDNSSPTYWLISSNPDEYDSINAFKNLPEIDWGNASNNHIEVGDIVYIYITKPQQRIAIKTEVTKSDFGVSELLDNDGQFNKSLDLRSREKYFRLKLIKFIDNDLLSLENLNQNGINGRIQGKRTVDGQALEYILENEDEKQEIKISSGNTRKHAFFENGVYETVLEEILEAQRKVPNITCYIQPYSTSPIVYLKNVNPSENNPIAFYISTTTNLNTVEYVAEIIGWEDKKELFVSGKERIKELNKHIQEYQKGEEEIYKYSDVEKTKECVNLVSIRNLRKLTIPFSVSMLTKVRDGEPLKSTRTQAGGWSEVYELDVLEKPVFIEEIDSELERNILASTYMGKNRQQRLEKANKKPEEIQIISRGFKRNADVIVEVLERANGFCERCNCKAPFIRAKDNTPYLEVHHKIMLSDGGDDSVENAIALCPNCHREMHFGV